MPDIITLFESFTEESKPQRLTPIAIGDALEKLQEFCPGYDAQDKARFPELWRGNSQEEEAFVCVPNATRRVSGHAANSVYNILVATYKQFDDRLESLICSTDIENASTYGETYVVVPRAGTVINVVPAPDMYFAYPDLCDFLHIGDLGEFASAVSKTLGLLGLPNSAAALKTAEEVRIAFDRLDAQHAASPLDTSKVQGGPWAKGYADAILSIPNRTGLSTYEYLLRAFDPVKAGFKQFRYGEPVDFDIEGKEVWFTGECIMINQYQFEQNTQ